VGEPTGQQKPELLFAIEAEPSSSDMSENLAAYRRLTACQKAVIAAELKRKIELEIAEESRLSRRRRKWRVKNDRPLFRLKSLLSKSLRSEFMRSLTWIGLDRAVREMRPLPGYPRSFPSMGSNSNSGAIVSSGRNP
jgi:hypothetical protein